MIQCSPLKTAKIWLKVGVRLSGEHCMIDFITLKQKFAGEFIQILDFPGEPNFLTNVHIFCMHLLFLTNQIF